MMIRNIPIKYTDKDLIEELEELSGKFDCVYLPYDYKKNGNRGYAFINFVHPLHILLFYKIFQDKDWLKYESKKICKLDAANYQGINEIKRHARNYKEKKPIFIDLRNYIANLQIPIVKLFCNLF